MSGAVQDSSTQAGETPAGHQPPQAGTQAQTVPGASFAATPVRPHYAAPLASRDHVAAGFLALVLGFFGVHKFYLGYNAQGFTLMALSVIGGLFSFGIAAGVAWIVAIIEGIVYLSKSQSEFEQVYVYGKREWF